MGLFSSRRRGKTADDGGDELLARMDGRLLSYAVVRTPDGETVLGHDGRLIVTSGELAIRFGSCDAFLCLREGSKCGELMNLSGVRIDGLLPDGSRKVAVAYYKSYRK